MIVEILATGNEVVDGDVVNTNASWLAQQIKARGFEVRFHSAVPDDETLIGAALKTAVARADLVLVTGGLGPTVDDLTLEVAGRTFGRSLQTDPVSLQRIRDFFSRLGRKLSPNQEKQAEIPAGAIPLANDVGTAPGAYWVEGKVRLAFFPGVPKEMKEMFHRRFLPLLADLQGGPKIQMKVLRCFGLPEGQMDQLLLPLLNERRELDGVLVGFRVRFPTIDVRLQGRGETGQEVERLLEGAARKIRAQLEEHVFGEGEDELEAVVGGLLRTGNLTLATAESCTGGLLASMITDVPGASDYFLEGAVTYSNRAKMRGLGVAQDTLDRRGAVSHEVALEMARGIRERSGADFGVGITGIAGPSGGSPEKPVGTVHIAVVHPGGEWEQAYRFPFDRLGFKQVAATTALDRLRRILLEIS